MLRASARAAPISRFPRRSAAARDPATVPRRRQPPSAGSMRPVAIPGARRTACPIAVAIARRPPRSAAHPAGRASRTASITWIWRKPSGGCAVERQRDQPVAVAALGGLVAHPVGFDRLASTTGRPPHRPFRAPRRSTRQSASRLRSARPTRRYSPAGAPRQALRLRLIVVRIAQEYRRLDAFARHLARPLVRHAYRFAPGWE